MSERDRVLHLLQHDCAEKVWLVALVLLFQQSLRDADHVVPHGPLILFVPDVRTLEQRNDQPLRLPCPTSMKCATCYYDPRNPIYGRD